MTSLSQDALSPDDRELLALCGKVRDGVVTPAEFAHLEARLLLDPQALDTYRRFMAICSGLEQTAIVRQTARQRSQMVAEVDSAAEPSLFVDRPRASHERIDVERSPITWRRREISMAVAATAAATIVFALIYLGRPGSNTDRFASVASTHQPVWGGQRELQLSEDAQEGEYFLASGAVEVVFANGAELLVQAPSRFSLHDEKRVTLSSGIVSLYIPPAATGFRIDTPFGSAIDHGTRIGVVADAESGMELHVFEGKAELVAVGASEGTMLAADKAATIDAESQTVASIDADPTYFAESLEQLSDLPVVSGDVELRISPPRSVRRVRAELVNVGRATVFAEQRDIEIQKDLPVTLASPGEAPSVSTNEATLPAGQHVDSFLVHFVLPRDQWRDDSVMNVSGQIMFERPIVGVVAHEPGKISDDFGHPSTEYPRDDGTGLEDSIDGETNQADHISLSPDQRTLSFQLRVHGRGHAEQVDRIDQLRVFVSSEINQ